MQNFFAACWRHIAPAPVFKGAPRRRYCTVHIGRTRALYRGEFLSVNRGAYFERFSRSLLPRSINK
jgi:hypothetical protein